MIDPTQIAKAAQSLAEAAKPERIILCGFHARGDACEDWNLDLLMIGSERHGGPEARSFRTCGTKQGLVPGQDPAPDDHAGTLMRAPS